MRAIVAYGTRPEKIKLSPVVRALKERGVEVVEWCSGQSKDLVNNFDDPTIRRSGAWGYGMAHGIAGTMESMHAILQVDKPAAVIVQGDTATAFACAQAAFLAGVPVAHVEAGMRTYQSEPFPEEAFRRQIAAVARWHFCPDRIAAENIWNENGWPQPEIAELWGEGDGVYEVGNTVIDTLPHIPFRVFATLHRRENWGPRIKSAIWQLEQFVHDNYMDAEVRIVRHPNWKAQGCEPHRSTILDVVDPLPREDLLKELQEASVVVTDSGGLQEEAAHFGIPCLVLRTSTERVSLERLGAVTLVDPDDDRALQVNLEAFLSKRRAYGAGDASEKIADILCRELGETTLDSQGESE